VAGGQPGVFYYFSDAKSATDVGRPAYFHQRDDRDASVNKGLEQLAVRIDGVVADNPDPAALAANADPGSRAPRLPRIDIDALPAGTSLNVRAVKAQTGAGVPMTLGVSIAALPQIALAQPLVAFGKPATARVTASDPDEQYQLALPGGDAIGAALPGTKADLQFDTPPVSADTAFELRITRAGDKGVPLERVMNLQVAVMPDAGRPVVAPADLIVSGSKATIVVQGSQTGVAYQLSVKGTAVGEKRAGTGADLALDTGPITADTLFDVIASRLTDPPASLPLTAQATVKLTPAPPV